MEATQQKNRILFLWPEGAPTSNGITGEEIEIEPNYITNVSRPCLMIYPANHPNGKVILMCPGGGLTKIALGHEGRDMAAWFNSMGFTYAVLKYRMPNGRKEIPLEDVQQGIRVLRSYADEWDIRQIGIMGASIGGYIAASAAVFATAEARPDFQILLYPAISMLPEFAHMKTREQLMGEYPSQEDVLAYSLEQHVTPQIVPAFIALASDDKTVSPENSLLYYLALLKNDVSVCLHIYPEGGHSFGFRDSFIYKREWTGELEKWLSVLR